MAAVVLLSEWIFLMLHYETALRSIIPAERRAAVRELCQVGSSVHLSALASLAVLLEDEDDAVREGAADVLTNVSQCGGAALDTVLEVIERMLTEGNVVARMKAAHLLSRIGPGARPLIPALIEALRDKNLILCRMAALALSHIGPAAILALEPLRDDVDVYVRREAHWALERLVGAPMHLSSDETIHTRQPNGAECATVRIEVSPSPPSVVRQLARTQIVRLDPKLHSDRRKDARHQACRQTFCCFQGDVENEMWWHGAIRDVSRTGVGLVLSRPASPGSALTVDLHEAHAVLTRKAVARVAHCRKINGGWFVGCTLLRPLAAEEYRLLKQE
jgi:hypothetical protein